MNKTQKRRYHLRNASTGDERIVLATSRSQALNHAAATDWQIDVLDTENAIRLTREGVTEEVAGDPDQQGLPLGDGSDTAVGGTD